MRSSAFALALALLLALAAAATARAESLDQIRKKGEIRIAVYNDYPPYSSDGRGLDVEVARALAARLGLKASLMWFNADENMDDDLRNVVWKGHYLGGGTADLMMHVPVDRVLIDNNDKVAIFAPYHRDELAIARSVSRVPNMTGMAGLEAFTREKIGVETATLADDFLMGAFGGRLRENVVHFKSVPLAASALKEGQLAAVMAPRTELDAAVGKVPGIAVSPFAPRSIAVSAWNIGVAVEADNPELKQAVADAIRSLLADGTLERIFAASGVTHVRPVEN